MTEFEFLDAQFNRLAGARSLRIHDEKVLKQKPKGKNPAPISVFLTAELIIQGAIIDYLKMRNSNKG